MHPLGRSTAAIIIVFFSLLRVSKVLEVEIAISEIATSAVGTSHPAVARRSQSRAFQFGAQLRVEARFVGARRAESHPWSLQGSEAAPALARLLGTAPSLAEQACGLLCAVPLLYCIPYTTRRHWLSRLAARGATAAYWCRHEAPAIPSTALRARA